MTLGGFCQYSNLHYDILGCVVRGFRFKCTLLRQQSANHTDHEIREWWATCWLNSQVLAGPLGQHTHQACSGLEKEGQLGPASTPTEHHCKHRQERNRRGPAEWGTTPKNSSEAVTGRTGQLRDSGPILGLPFQAASAASPKKLESVLRIYPKFWGLLSPITACLPTGPGRGFVFDPYNTSSYIVPLLLGATSPSFKRHLLGVPPCLW